MRYTIRLTEKEPVFPVVEFEDRKYNLLGEFMLAERGLLRHFADKFDELMPDSETSVEVSGNVFTMTSDNKFTTISNDITEQEITVDTSEFMELIIKYYSKLKEVKSNL